MTIMAMRVIERKMSFLFIEIEGGLLLNGRTIGPEGLGGTSGELDVLADNELFRELAGIDNLHARTANDFAKDLLFDERIARHLLAILEMFLETIQCHGEELLINRLEPAEFLHPFDERRATTFKEWIFLLTMRALAFGPATSGRAAFPSATNALCLLPRGEL